MIFTCIILYRSNRIHSYKRAVALSTMFMGPAMGKAFSSDTKNAIPATNMREFLLFGAISQKLVCAMKLHVRHTLVFLF